MGEISFSSSNPPHLLHIIRSASESVRVLPVFGLPVLDLVSLRVHVDT